MIRQVGLSLNLTSLSKSEIDYTTTDPRDETRRVSEVDKPIEDSSSGI